MPCNSIIILFYFSENSYFEIKLFVHFYGVFFDYVGTLMIEKKHGSASQVSYLLPVVRFWSLDKRFLFKIFSDIYHHFTC